MTIVMATKLLLLAIGLWGGVEAGGDAADQLITGDDNQLRLNQIQTLGTHNSYHVIPKPNVMSLLGLLERQAGFTLSAGFAYSHAPITTQLQDLEVRHFELDVFADPGGGLYATRGVLKVLNENPASGIPALSQPGYKVLHVSDIDYESVCLTLVSCLKSMSDWSLAHPGHLPIMVNLEVKEVGIPLNLGLNFSVPVPADFNALEQEVRGVFAANRLIEPSSILGSADNIRDGLRANGWPTLGSSRNKFIFTLQGGGNFRQRYTNGDAKLTGKLFFPASNPGDPDCVFAILNDAVGQLDAIQSAVRAGLLVRTRADAETLEARNGLTDRRDAALRSGAQYVSTDYPRGVDSNLVSTDIKTGYRVNLRPRCNPLFVAQTGCQATMMDQAPVTPPPSSQVYRPSGSLDSLSISTIFPNGIANTPQIRQFLLGWSEIAKVNTTNLIGEGFRRDQSYTIPTYAPNHVVQNLHNTPRLGGATNNFDTNTRYLLGLLWIVLPFFAIALLLALASLFFFCNCACQCRQSLKHHTTHNLGCFNKLLIAGVFFVSISGCVVAIVGDTFLFKQIRLAKLMIKDAGVDIALMNSFSGSFSGSIQGIAQAQKSFSESCSGLDLTSGLSLNSGTETMLRAIDDIVRRLRNLPGAVSSGSLVVERANLYHAVIVVTLISFLVLLVISFAASLTCSPAFLKIPQKASIVRARVVRYAIIPLGIIVLCLCMALSGVLISVNVAVSDFCTSPDNSIDQFVQQTGNNSFVDFFFRCEGLRMHQSNIVEQSEMLHLIRDLDPVVRNLAVGTCSIINPSRTQDIQNRYLELSKSVIASDNLVQGLGLRISCNYINGAYSNLVYKTICNDMPISIMLVWAGLVITVVGSIVAMWSFGSMAMTDRIYQWQANDAYEKNVSEEQPGYESKSNASVMPMITCPPSGFSLSPPPTTK